MLGGESSGLKIDSSLRVRIPLSMRTNEKRTLLTFLALEVTWQIVATQKVTPAFMTISLLISYFFFFIIDR